MERCLLTGNNQRGNAVLGDSASIQGCLRTQRWDSIGAVYSALKSCGAAARFSLSTCIAAGSAGVAVSRSPLRLKKGIFANHLLGKAGPAFRLSSAIPVIYTSPTGADILT